MLNIYCMLRVKQGAWFTASQRRIFDRKQQNFYDSTYAYNTTHKHSLAYVSTRIPYIYIVKQLSANIHNIYIYTYITCTPE